MSTPCSLPLSPSGFTGTALAESWHSGRNIAHPVLRKQRIHNCERSYWFPPRPDAAQPKKTRRNDNGLLPAAHAPHGARTILRPYVEYSSPPGADISAKVV